MQPMSAKRRFLAGLMGGRVDRTPVGSPTSVATIEQMEMTGAFFPDVHLDAPKMARLAAGAYEILGYDAIMPVFSVTQESAALGCTMHWGDVDMMPVALDHPFVEPEQVIIPDDFLDLPPIKTVLDAITLLRQTYGSHVAIIGKVMGPWTLSYHLRGINDFLLETLTEPDKVRRFLDQLKLVPLLFGRAQIAAGADVLCLADHATGDLVRGTMYRDMLQPIHKELVQELGCPLILHICGNTLDRLSYIADAGFDAFHFDSKVDAVAAVQAVGDRLSLIGNVNNPEVLYAGTPQQAEAQARYAIAAGVRIVGPECAVPLRTPIANLKAICQAVA
jgi:[methyl-Co(III) methanol-specific corrinoid protein]:coenzyme M methyltransferase